MLPVSLDCPFLIAPSVFSNVYSRLVYPMLPVSLNCPFLIAPSVFSNFYCRLVCLMLPVSLDCPFLIAPAVFSNVYFVLCALCCQFLWIVSFWLPLWYSLTFICLVYPMLPVSLDCPFSIALSLFSNVYSTSRIRAKQINIPIKTPSSCIY